MLSKLGMWTIVVSSLTILRGPAQANFNSLSGGSQSNFLLPYSTKGEFIEEEKGEAQKQDEFGPENLLECGMDTLVKFLSVEGLSTLLLWTSKVEEKSAKSILESVALDHGLTVQDEIPKLPSHHFAFETRSQDFQNGLQNGIQNGLQNSFQNGGKEKSNDVSRLFELISTPRTKMNSDFEVSTPDGLPRALLVVLSSSGRVLIRQWIDLAPRTSFLDFIKFASEEKDIDGKSDIGLDFKMKKLRSRKCLGLAYYGPLRGSPYNPLTLLIKIFSSSLKVIWEDACLPKVNDLLIYPGFVVTISPLI